MKLVFSWDYRPSIIRLMRQLKRSVRRQLN